MVGWHHQLNGHKFEQTLGVGDGQGGLACVHVVVRVRHDWVTELYFPSIEIFSTKSGFPVSWLKYWNFSFSIHPFKQYQDWFPLGLTDFVSWNPMDSQEPSPSSYFKSMDSLALSLLYGPTLTSVYDYWKNHSSDYMDLCQQSDVSAF